MTRKVSGVKARIDGRGRIVLPASLRSAWAFSLSKAAAREAFTA